MLQEQIPTRVNGHSDAWSRRVYGRWTNPGHLEVLVPADLETIEDRIDQDTKGVQDYCSNGFYRRRNR